MNEETIMKEFKELRVCLSNIDKTLAINTTIIKEHERRSLALEQEVRGLEKHWNKVLGAFIAIQVLIPIVLKFLVP